MKILLRKNKTFYDDLARIKSHFKSTSNSCLQYETNCLETSKGIILYNQEFIFWYVHARCPQDFLLLFPSPRLRQRWQQQQQQQRQRRGKIIHLWRNRGVYLYLHFSRQWSLALFGCATWSWILSRVRRATENTLPFSSKWIIRIKTLTKIVLKNGFKF